MREKLKSEGDRWNCENREVVISVGETASDRSAEFEEKEWRRKGKNREGKEDILGKLAKGEGEWRECRESGGLLKEKGNCRR